MSYTVSFDKHDTESLLYELHVLYLSGEAMYGHFYRPRK